MSIEDPSGMMRDTPAFTIRAVSGAFRRAGMSHSEVPVRHPAGTFTRDQVHRLKAEPKLVVVEHQAEAAPPVAPAPAASPADDAVQAEAVPAAPAAPAAAVQEPEPAEPADASSVPAAASAGTGTKRAKGSSASGARVPE